MAFKAHLETLATTGLVPYVATSKGIVPSLDLSSLGRAVRTYVVEREGDQRFLEALLTAETLGFQAAGAKLPTSVLVDCVLMQTAVVGFALSRRRAGSDLIKSFAAASKLDPDALDYLPVSGHIAGLGLDGNRLVGCSLFSLRRYLPAVPALGVITKAASLLAYRARGRRFIGISQYDNKILSMHAKFGRPMWIEAPRVLLHSNPEMSLVYGMTIDFDPDHLHERDEPGTYDFMLRADDADLKAEIAHGIEKGWRYIIVPPYQIEANGIVQLPIQIQKAP